MPPWLRAHNALDGGMQPSNRSLSRPYQTGHNLRAFAGAFAGLFPCRPDGGIGERVRTVHEEHEIPSREQPLPCILTAHRVTAPPPDSTFREMRPDRRCNGESTPARSARCRRLAASKHRRARSGLPFASSQADRSRCRTTDSPSRPPCASPARAPSLVQPRFSSAWNNIDQLALGRQLQHERHLTRTPPRPSDPSQDAL